MFNFNVAEVFSIMDSRLLEKARKMEKIMSPKELDNPIAIKIDISNERQGDINSHDLPVNLVPRTDYEIDGKYYETDDNGNIYKTDGELNTDAEYTMNGITYKTDSKGRIISWNGEPGYNLDAERDEGAQTDVGGEDRRDGDDGGHLVARIFNGSPGRENIVPMRDTINRGDYKKSENEIAKAKQEDKYVYDSGKVIYEGESSRPSKIERVYTIDGETRELKIDNVEGSYDLLEDVKDDIREEDYRNLEERVKDMEEDNYGVSVTSVYRKYDDEGNLEFVTVGITDDSNRVKTYIKYEV